MTSKEKYSFIKNFESQDNLKEFGNNALLLYLFDLMYSIDDIRFFASEYLVDNSDDKKTDLVFIDKDEKKAIIAQSYYSKKTKDIAPSNKASSLSTSMIWLLSANIDDLPTSIKSAAIELRNALKNQEVDRIELWYVHNCLESKNVENELKTAAIATKKILEASFPNIKCDVTYIEWGLNRIEDRYKSTTTAILVNEIFKINIPGGFEIKGDGWHSFSTTVDASWLHDLFVKYETDLFSANIRDYLGSRKSDKNINNGIKETAKREPEKFWVYNNGITAIVNNFNIDKNNSYVEIDGIAIVNGAQTIGSLGSLDDIPAKTAKVPIRFIKANSKELISNIIRYNNRQNKISAADFRSVDNVQRRLKKEFETKFNAIIYKGARRGSAEDKIKRDLNDLPYDRVVQCLAAFHMHPGLAYNKKTKISESDELYNIFFNESTHAEHIVFVYSLFSAIAKLKLNLMKKEKDGELTNPEKERLDFLKNRGAVWIFMAALGESLNIIIDGKAPNKFIYRFRDRKGTVEDYERIWNPIINIGISFRDSLKKPLEEVLSNETNNQEAIKAFKSLMESVKEPNEKLYRAFSEKVNLENYETQ